MHAAHPETRHPKPDTRASRVRYVVMAFLCALSFLTYFDRVCIMRAQGEISASLHLSEQQMGWVLGAFWLAYALFEIPGGWLGDRFGSRITLTRIVLGWSVFTALSGTAVGFVSLYASRFLFGAGEAGAFPNMARVQSRWLPANVQARSSGILWLVARWGGAFSGVILGAVLRWAGRAHFYQPWRIGFFISGIAGLVWCVLFFPWFRDDPSEKSSVNEAELAHIRKFPMPEYVEEPVPWSGILTSTSLWALSLLYFSGNIGWSFFVSWMPKFLEKVHHITFEKSEWMTAGPLFFGGVACLIGGSLSDLIVRVTGMRRVGRAILPICGMLIAAGCMMGIRATHSPRTAVILMCVASAGYDLGQAINWAAIIAIGGKFAGTATGFMNMLGNFGNFVGPPLGAFIFLHWKWNPLFAVYAAAYVFAGSMWLFINPTRTFYGERAN
jgi:MFS family permease